MAKALDRVVVEVQVRHFQIVGQRFGLDRKAVVLRGDLHPAAVPVHHGLVGAAMAELQLVGLRAAGQRQQLMAQADAEDRLLAQQTRGSSAWA